MAENAACGLALEEHSWGKLTVPTALLYSETGWVPLQTHWDAARLRLLGSILSSPASSPYGRWRLR